MYSACGLLQEIIWRRYAEYMLNVLIFNEYFAGLIYNANQNYKMNQKQHYFCKHILIETLLQKRNSFCPF